MNLTVRFAMHVSIIKKCISLTLKIDAIIWIHLLMITRSHAFIYYDIELNFKNSIILSSVHVNVYYS